MGVYGITHRGDCTDVPKTAKIPSGQTSAVNRCLVVDDFARRAGGHLAMGQLQPTLLPPCDFTGSAFSVTIGDSEEPMIPLADSSVCDPLRFERPRMTQHTKYQQNIIKNYYKNRDSISLQRLQELVTELFLASGKKREKHWDSVALHLSKLGVKPDVISHLRREDKPENVATLVKKLMEKQ